jgi:hypothetical protein
MNGKRSGFVGTLEAAARDNPVSTALVGVGLLWMFFGGSRVTAAAALIPNAARAAGELAARGSQASKEFGAGAATSVGEYVDKAVEVGRVAVDKVSASAKYAPEAGSPAVAGFSQLTAGVGQQLGEVFERQPLLLGAVGIAVGAGIGASLPSSTVENDLFGATADSVKAQASEIFDAQKANAGKVVDTIKDAAEAEGLTPKAAMDAAANVPGAISRVANAVVRHDEHR